MDKGKYQIVKGDVTQPVGEGIKIIPHIISDIGVCGAGVAKVVAKKWPDVVLDIQSVKGRDGELTLGKCVFSRLESNRIIVVSMVAQKGLKSRDNPTPIKYTSLMICMRKVRDFIMDVFPDAGISLSIHCPKFGAGLAGGDWRFVETLIKEIWVDNGINVVVYE